MVIADGLLTVTVRATVAIPGTTLVMDRVRPMQNSMSHAEIQGGPQVEVGIYHQ